MRDRDDLSPREGRSPAEIEATIERNIARLLRAADHPAIPSELALARWRERMRRELPAVARRERLRRRRSAFGPVAAAALLVLGLTAALPFLRDRGPSFPLRAGAAPIEIRLAGREEWRPLAGERSLRPGDSVRLGEGSPPGSLEVELPGKGLFALDRGAVRNDGERLHVVRGEGEWSAPERRRGALATPLLLLRASDADVRVSVREADPHAGEGNEMSTRKLAAIGGGLAVIVTVIVLSTGDEPVEVERGGERVALREGDSAEARSASGIAVTRGEAAARSEAPAAPAPAPAGIPAADETPAESTREISLAVVDPTGLPVAGAAVAIAVSPAVAGAGDTEPAPEGDPEDAGEEVEATRNARTDEEGLARLRVPTSWTAAAVEVSAPRHASVELPWVSPEAQGEELAGAGVPDETAVAEPWTITLPFETSISGRVLGRENAEAVPGALVGIQRDVGPQGWSDPVVRTFEEADGSFYFGPIAPGRYWVWAYREGSVRTETTTVEVAEGQRVSGLELFLAPGAMVRVSAFEKRTGLPVAGAVAYPHLDHLPGTVDLVHRGESIDARVRNAARTGEDGVATLDDLPLRRTLLRVLHRGYRPVDVWVEPSAEAPVEVEVALEPGPSIRGDVLDAAGKPVNGTQVLAITMSLDSKMSELSMVPVVDGAYEVENVNPGMYIVLHSTFAEEDEHFKMKFTTVPADTDAVVDFVELAELATLRGRITDATGAPVPRGVVTVSTLDELGEVIFESSTTDADGRFEIRNLALKEWAVGVSSSPESMVTIGVVKLEQAIDYEEEFTLPSGAIEGTVVDLDGVPAQEVELFLFSVDEDGELDWMGRAEAGSDGGFAFRGLPPARYRVLVQGLAVRQEFTRDIALADGAIERLEVIARPAGKVRVVVLDAAGEPAPDIGVRIVDAAGEPRNDGLPARTGADGAYEFPSLGPGEYRVQLRRGAEVLPIEKGFTAAIGETVEVRITLP